MRVVFWSFSGLNKTLYQPFQCVTIDESGKTKTPFWNIPAHRRQQDKLTKWIIKLWDLADSLNG